MAGDFSVRYGPNLSDASQVVSVVAVRDPVEAQLTKNSIAFPHKIYDPSKVDSLD